MTSSATLTYAFRLCPGAVHVTTPDGQSILRTVLGVRALRLSQLNDGESAVLRRLTGPPASTPQLRAIAPELPTDRLNFLLERLWTHGWLQRTAKAEGRDLYTVIPLRAVPMSEPTPATLMLSRFTVLHRDADDVLVESPLARCALLVHDPLVVAALAALTPAAGVTPSGPLLSALPDDVWPRLLEDLFHGGLAVPITSVEDSGTVADTDSTWAQWSPHELWFHWRSRTGPHMVFSGPVGRLRDPRGKCKPVPQRRESYPGPSIHLHRPDLAALARTDHTLTTVLEERRSWREHDDTRPLSLTQVGEFLFRCARAVCRPGPDGKLLWTRPYPSGGGAYELEIYLIVRLVIGLAPGIYHYDPFDHALRAVSTDLDLLAHILHFAQLSSVKTEPPQLLFVFTAQFDRLLNHYHAIGGATIVKNVGVLQQTMYMVGTAMGLATCALGSGVSDLFNRAAGLDFCIESPVGEFMLGSRTLK